MMKQPGEYTRREIESQPDVWGQVLQSLFYQESALAGFLHAQPLESVLFTGCGSTYYLSLAAAAHFQSQTGIPSRGLPASEIWLDPAAAYPSSQRHLLVAVSRSGETTETLRAVRAFQQRGNSRVLTLSCYGDKPLAGLGDMNLVFPDAQEQSVAQTRAFSSLYLAALALAGIYQGALPQEQWMGLPAAGRHLLQAGASTAAGLGRSPRFDRFYFLGSGARYGLACEVSLKMKEMSLSHSEAFRFLEFRHGPMSMVNASTLITGFVSAENLAHEQAVLEEMRARGAEVLSLAEQEATIEFRSGLPAHLRNVLYLLPIQVLAFEHALAKGLDPDLPHNLSAVVRLS